MWVTGRRWREGDGGREMEVGERGEGGWVSYEGLEEDGVEEQGR